MSFLKQFFGSSKTIPSEITVREVCQFTIEDGECSLVQQLKQKQAEKRELDAKIKSLREPAGLRLGKFIIFLVSMESRGFEMTRGYHWPKSTIRRELSSEYGLCKFQDIVGRMTDDQLEGMFQELRDIKHKDGIISDLQQRAVLLGEEIAELKTKLGIE